MAKITNIKQELLIKANPHQVYEALMDSKKHSQFTGEPAKISRKVGGSFTAYGDYISGKNLELSKDKKIIQSWRASDWPEGHFSTATFLLKQVKGGTKLAFSQKGVPAKETKSILKGWEDFYWEPLRSMLEK